MNGCLACNGPLESDCTEFEPEKIDDPARFKL
jgi:hypothetical protein